MPTLKLTKRTVDAAPPEAKVYSIYDSDLRGFTLRIMPSGAKSYVLEYKPGGGRKASTRRLTLGSAATLTADEARKAARELLARIRLGEDPAGARQARRAMPSVSEFAERFLEEYCRPPRVKPRTKRLYVDNLRRLAAPHIGSMKLDAVARTDVARMHRKIGKDRPTSANNLLVTIASLYKFAASEGLLPEGTNPARAVEKFKANKIERYLTGDELARLGDAIREAETIGIPWRENELKDPSRAKHRPKNPEKRTIVLPPDVAAALRLLLLTGCRKSEILGLRWSEVDFERGILWLADSKTGKRHVILNAPALQILSEIPKVGPFVFPGQSAEKARSDFTGLWYRIRERAELDGKDGKPPFRLHDLRHSFASVGVGGGLGLPIVGKLLGHTQAATTQRYAHLDSDPIKRAADRIGAAIAAGMGDAPSATNNIKALHTSQRLDVQKLRK